MRHHRPRRNGIRHLEEKVLRWEWDEGAEETARAEISPAPVEADEEEGVPDNSGPQVIYSEKYPVKPMFIDEAVLQMEMSPKQFLVFLNAKTEKVSVIYRRKSGDFGLIEPTFN
jgi:putative sigma-54 modulation protein